VTCDGKGAHASSYCRSFLDRTSRSSGWRSAGSRSAARSWPLWVGRVSPRSAASSQPARRRPRQARRSPRIIPRVNRPLEPLLDWHRGRPQATCANVADGRRKPPQRYPSWNGFPGITRPSARQPWTEQSARCRIPRRIPNSPHPAFPSRRSRVVRSAHSGRSP
jgi:hypothetical protein